MGNRIGRTYGTVLTGKLAEEKSITPASPVETKFFDVDHYNLTGELLTPEEVAELKETEENDVPRQPHENKPTKEQLAEDQLIMTKSQAMEKYGCSKSSLKRWTKEYGLPRWDEKGEVIVPDKTIYTEDDVQEIYNIAESAEPDPPWENTITSKQLSSDTEPCPGSGEKDTEGDCKEEEDQTAQNAFNEQEVENEMVMKDMPENAEEIHWKNIQKELVALRNGKIEQVDRELKSRLEQMIDIR